MYLVYLVRHAFKEDGSGRYFLGGREEAMGEVPAVGQVKPHDAAVWLHHARVHREVCWRSYIQTIMLYPHNVMQNKLIYSMGNLGTLTNIVYRYCIYAVHTFFFNKFYIYMCTYACVGGAKLFFDL